MSRIGKLPITIPDNVRVELTDGQLQVHGQKGDLSLKIHDSLLVTLVDGDILVAVKNKEDKTVSGLWGTFQRLISNMIAGVTDGFVKILEFNGVGWRMEVTGAGGASGAGLEKFLVMNVGFSTPVKYKITQGIDISVDKNLITVSGIDKQLVGQVAAEIRSIRKPEPYKGKGIKYQNENLRRKAGKQAKSASA